MKLITAIIKPFRLDDVRNALAAIVVGLDLGVDFNLQFISSRDQHGTVQIILAFQHGLKLGNLVSQFPFVSCGLLFFFFRRAACVQLACP